MIIAVEGPDLCGKSSLFSALRGLVDAVFVPRMPLAPELMQCMAAVEARHEAVWRALYDSTKLYVCDRHVAVTSAVYARLYGREVPDVSWWAPELRVVYLDASLELLLARHAAIGDEHMKPTMYAAALAAYDEVLSKLDHVRLGASLPLSELTQLCLHQIEVWNEQRRSRCVWSSSAARMGGMGESARGPKTIVDRVLR